MIPNRPPSCGTSRLGSPLIDDCLGVLSAAPGKRHWTTSRLRQDYSRDGELAAADKDYDLYWDNRLAIPKADGLLHVKLSLDFEERPEIRCSQDST